MNQRVLALVPYLVSLALSLGIGAYAWRRREVGGARYFAVWTFSQSAWTAGFVAEIVSHELAVKLFWDTLQWIPAMIAPLGLLAFVFEYTGRRISHPTRFWGGLIGIGLILLGLALSNPLHGLAQFNVHLEPGEPYSALRYSFGPIDWLLSIYGYGVAAFALYLLAAILPRSPALYRRQATIVMVGIGFPFLLTVLNFTGIVPTFQSDITPGVFGLANVVVAWGLFRYRLFDVVPAARQVVVAHLPDPIMVLDRQNRLIDVNPAAERMLNQRANDLIGRVLSEVVEPAWQPVVQRYAGTDQVQFELNGEIQGERRFLDVSLLPVLDNRGQVSGRLLIVHDITERKLVEFALQDHSAQLETANQALTRLTHVKDEFVSNVSHELRTPLTNFKLYLSLLSRVNNLEKQADYVAILRRETSRLEGLIENLLLLSRLDQQRVDFTFGPVDLNGLVTEFRTDRMALAREHGIDLRMDLAAQVPLVQVDGGLIGTVLSILVTNAVHYTPSGGTVTLGTHQDPAWAGISVSDTGPGISPEEQPRLFTRFFRGSAGHASGQPGTGLGLAIACEIVQHHGGRLEVTSEGLPGRGSTFYVWLPAPPAVS